LANDPEPRALARAGEGGGYVGWALSQLIAGIFDPIFSTIVYGVIFAFAVSRAIGIQRKHVTYVLEWAAENLNELASRLEGRAVQLDASVQAAASSTTGPVQDAAAAATSSPETKAKTTRQWRPSVVDRKPPAQTAHVRPLADKPASVPVPEMDAEIVDEATAAPVADPIVVPTQHYEPAAPTVDVESDDLPDEFDEAPRINPEDLPHYVNPTPEKMERGLSSPGLPGDRPSIVPRDDEDEGPMLAVEVPRRKRNAKSRRVQDDDGRIVREFRVDDLQETRKVAKRSDDLPPFELLRDSDLNRPDDDEINENARIIEETLREFDIHVEVVDVKIGPSVTQYAVQPFTEIITPDGERIFQRVRVGRITTLERDLALALSAKRLRIQAPVPGHSYVGVEVPNREPSLVTLRGVMESEAYYRKRKLPLGLPLGRDVSGSSFVADLATMPHLLIAGTTGSGKSVALTAVATSLIMNNTPDRLKLVMLDPKMVELTRFNGIPHLMGPVEYEQERILGVLRWAAREMDRRYKLLEVAAARNIETYNRALGRRRKDEHLPYIAIIFDEIGDLMLSRPDETEKMLARLAQMARAVGIHLIVATQRPSVDVITGLIKANFPARISFAVASGVDSRVILDTVGAETLMGKGDMLYQASDAAGPQRLQGCFVSDEELQRVVQHWIDWDQTQMETGAMVDQGPAPWERGMTRREILSETDPMLEQAIQLVLDEGEASASLIQRRMGVGYPRAARLMDLLEELGIVGAATSGGRTREVLYKSGDDPFKNIVDKRIDPESS
jgi:DNA segregation ATPase FtsK/SpoIIIE-like protein